MTKELTLNDMTKDELLQLIALLPVKPRPRDMRLVRSETLQKRADVEYRKYELQYDKRTMAGITEGDKHWKRYEALSQESLDILSVR